MNASIKDGRWRSVGSVSTQSPPFPRALEEPPHLQHSAGTPNIEERLNERPRKYERKGGADRRSLGAPPCASGRCDNSGKARTIRAAIIVCDPPEQLHEGLPAIRHQAETQTTSPSMKTTKVPWRKRQARRGCRVTENGYRAICVTAIGRRRHAAPAPAACMPVATIRPKSNSQVLESPIVQVCVVDASRVQRRFAPATLLLAQRAS